MINRIIGILVVLAIGVLISPLVMNHYHATVQTESSNAPPFPGQQAQSDTAQALEDNGKLKEIRVLKAKGGKLAKAKNHSAKLADAETEATDNKITKTELKNAVWVIQVGTFKDKVSALRMVNTLRAKGYNAFFHQKKLAFGEATHVYIGPEAKKDSAEMLASKLAKDTHILGTVQSYNPLAA